MGDKVASLFSLSLLYNVASIFDRKARISRMYARLTHAENDKVASSPLC